MRMALRAGACIASLTFVACAAHGAASVPSFGEFHEPFVKMKSGARPKLISNHDREFKTRIAEASGQGVNFTGHYVLSLIGCGASCVMSFALDKKSGEISWLPFTVCCWDSVEIGAKPIAFMKDSRLVVINGSRNEQGKGIYYYEFKKSQFVLIQEAER